MERGDLNVITACIILICRRLGITKSEINFVLTNMRRRHSGRDHIDVLLETLDETRECNFL